MECVSLHPYYPTPCAEYGVWYVPRLNYAHFAGPIIVVEINEMVSVILISSGSSLRLQCRWMTCLNLYEIRCIDVDPMPQISALPVLFLLIREQIDLLTRYSIRAFEQYVIPTNPSMGLLSRPLKNFFSKKK